MGLLDQMMASIYKPPKQEKTALPKNLTPARAAKMAAQTNVTQGQLLRGEVLDLRAKQIMVLLENGATVTARTEGTLNLSIGQNAQFLVAQTTEDQILLKLAQEDTATENPMIEKALTAANIIRTDRSIAIVTELLAHQQPVTEKNIRHYLSLSTKHPKLPVKDLILMDLHHIPITKETVEQFANYQNRNGKLLTQMQNLLQNLTETVEKLPKGNLKQSVLEELTEFIDSNRSSSTGSASSQPYNALGSELFNEPMNSLTGKASDTQQTTLTNEIFNKQQLSSANETFDRQQLSSANEMFEHQQTSLTNKGMDSTAALPPSQAERLAQAGTVNTFADTFDHAVLSGRGLEADRDSFMKEFLNSFLLNPEDIADPDKVQQYYNELQEKLDQLEQLSLKLAENTKEAASDAPKQMRSNLSFMEAVNQVFPYVQLPLKFREAPAHGELYVYEKKRAMKPSDTLSALLHLDLENLGTTDIFITLSGHHVTTRFSMTDKESGDFIRNEMPELTKALASKGYTLQSEVTVREPSEEEHTPTLLEQFLEDHAPGGLNRYTFDIRA